MHVQLARLADCPEIAMTEADAKTLMVSAQNVLRHYSIQATQKAVDIMTFASVATFMYAPRAVAFKRRRQRRSGRSSGAPPDGMATPAGPAHVVYPFRAAPGPDTPQPPIIDLPADQVH
jgi:hypothetical protein